VLNLVQYFSNFDAEGRVKHGGNPALLVDFTDALVTLTEISFYCATICGLLGAVAEIVAGVFELYSMLEERRERVNRKSKSGDFEGTGVKLEKLLMEQVERDAGKKKKQQQQRLEDVEMKSFPRGKEKSRRIKKNSERIDEELLTPKQLKRK
jgi:hypothetical protein